MHCFFKKSLSIAMLSIVALTASAQDLIAKQAPSDKRMKDVNNVKLHRAASAAINLNNPASEIYTDWNNEKISDVAGSLPANFKVDLRGFCMPTPSRKVTSNFGPRWGGRHAGIDVKVYIGDTIVSAFDGKVRIVKYDGRGYGYYVVVRHPNGLETLYGHLSKQLVKPDQIVKAGQPIGLGGNTGRSTGSHLHFETRVLGKAINPAFMFDFESQDVTGDFYAVDQTTSKRTPAKTTAKAAKEKDNTPKAAPKESTKQTKAIAANTQQQQATPDNQPAANDDQPAMAQAEGGVTYAVKRGDTLFSIARMHGTTVDELCRLNGIKSRAILKTGQILRCS